MSKLETNKQYKYIKQTNKQTYTHTQIKVHKLHFSFNLLFLVKLQCMQNIKDSNLFTVAYSVLLIPFITSYLFKTIQEIGCDSSNWEKQHVDEEKCALALYRKWWDCVWLNTDSTVLINCLLEAHSHQRVGQYYHEPQKKRGDMQGAVPSSELSFTSLKS